MLQNGENGLEVINPIKSAHPKAIIIVFSLYETPEFLYILKKYGVNAFFPKTIDVTYIKEYLNHIPQYIDQFYAPHHVHQWMEVVNNELIDAIIKNLQKLTPIEKNILKLKINQYKNTHIAHILNLKIKTVENYINRISNKLSYNNMKFNDFLDKYQSILKILIS